MKKYSINHGEQYVLADSFFVDNNNNVIFYKLNDKNTIEYNIAFVANVHIVLLCDE